MTLLVSLHANSGYIGISYEGIIDYKSYSKSFKSDTFKPLISKADKILVLEHSLRKNLKAEALKQIVEDGGKLTRFSFDLDGPTKLKLTGLPEGNIKISIGGFKLNMYLKAEFFYGFSVGKVRVTSHEILLVGTYDIYTGVISDIGMDNSVVLTESVDVDLALDWFPLLNHFVTNKYEAEYKAKIVTKINEIFNANLANQNTFFGLDTSIPIGVYNYYGIDLGQQAITSLRNLISGESVEFTLRDRLISNSHWNTININFSDSLNISISEIPTRITPEYTTVICNIER